MKNLLLIIILILVTMLPAHADFALGFGTGITTQYETTQNAENGRELIDFGSGRFGLGFDAEWMRDQRLSISISGVYRKEDATVQFNKNGNFVPNLNAQASTLALSLGPRFRFINWKHLRVFLGAGLGAGYLDIDYNRDQFRDEGHSLFGYYYEAGVELYITQRSAFRLMGRHTAYETQEFETIDGKSLNVALTQFSLQYFFFL